MPAGEEGPQWFQLCRGQGGEGCVPVRAGPAQGQAQQQQEARQG